MSRPGGTRPTPAGSEAIGAAGAVLEWYDFSLYVYLAPIYARIFFGGGGVEQLLATFGVFFVAYLARPVGAVVFGHIGDRRGRTSSLTTSALIMAVALLVNGLLPTESAIGAAAPVLLVLARVATGFAVGGEYSGILVFLLETATDRNRGLVVSWAPAVSGAGILLAVGTSALVTGLLDQEALDSWGWRIPVLLGAALAFGIWLLRRRLGETDAFEAMRADGELAEAPVREVLRVARRAVWLTFLLSAVGSVAYYLNITYVPTLLSTFTATDSATALRWSTLATALVLVTTPLVGWSTDRFGRRPLLVALAVTLAVTTPPLLLALEASTAAVVVAATCLLAVTAGAWSAATAATIPEQFPAHIRFSGIAVGYNTAVALFGGLTPLLATWLIDTTGSVVAPGWVAAAVAVVGLVTALRLRETAGRPLPR